MSRSMQSPLSEADWSIVSAKHPCPICGASAGCRTHEDAAFASCAHRPSDWLLTNGSWLHRLVRRAIAAKDAVIFPQTNAVSSLAGSQP